MDQPKVPAWVVSGDEEKRRWNITQAIEVTGLDTLPRSSRDKALKMVASVKLPLIVNLWPAHRMGLDIYMLDADEWSSVDWGRVDAWVKLTRGHQGGFADHASYASWSVPIKSHDGTLAMLDELVNRVLAPAITS